MVCQKMYYGTLYVELSVEAAISLSFYSDRLKIPFFLLPRLYERKVDFTVEKNVLKLMGETFILNLV